MNSIWLGSEKIRKELVEDDCVSLENLPELLQRQVAPGTGVTVLKRGRWVRAGDYWLILKEVSLSKEYASARVLVTPYRAFLDLFGAEVEVRSYGVIPNTHLRLLMVHGSQWTPLVIEVREELLRNG